MPITYPDNAKRGDSSGLGEGVGDGVGLGVSSGVGDGAGLGVSSGSGDGVGDDAGEEEGAGVGISGVGVTSSTFTSNTSSVCSGVALFIRGYASEFCVERRVPDEHEKRKRSAAIIQMQT